VRDDISERRQLAVGRAIAAKVRADPDRVLALGRRNLARMRAMPSLKRAGRWLDEWERVINEGSAAVAELLSEQGEHGHDMRRTMPFAGALTNEERWAVLREVYREVA